MNHQITWSDLQTEKREKRREAIIEGVARAILIALIAIFFYLTASGFFMPNVNEQAVNYLYELDMRGEIALNNKAITALQLIK
jgi:hypothetical protein